MLHPCRILYFSILRDYFSRGAHEVSVSADTNKISRELRRPDEREHFTNFHKSNCVDIWVTVSLDSRLRLRQKHVLGVLRGLGAALLSGFVNEVLRDWASPCGKPVAPLK